MIPSRAAFLRTALIALLLLGAPSRHGEAHDIPDSGNGGIDGVYELKEVTAAGVYSAGEMAEAEAFLGHFLTVHGEHVVLPDNVLCHIASTEAVMLKDDLESFGSAGGSWSEIGLTRTSETGYEVTVISFDCDGPFGQLLVQPASETVLLSYWAVFLILGRE